MSRWLWLLCCLWLCSFAWPAAVFTDELNTELYDCTLTLATAESATQVVLEKKDEKDFLSLTVTPEKLTLAQVLRGRSSQIAQAELGVRAGERLRLVIQRRGNTLCLLRDDAVLYRGEVPRIAGGAGAIQAGKGWAIEDSTVRRLEPVVFADDFMRTADEPGPWTTVSGQWALSSAWDEVPHGNDRRFSASLNAQNPFAWTGSAENGDALCMTGSSDWEDYAFSAAVRPLRDGAMGMAVNLADAQNGFLVRWSAGNDPRPDGRRLTLFKMTDGNRILLAESPGGYIPGQWYKLTVVSHLGDLRVLVDGEERLHASAVTPRRGKVGLYTEGNPGATFDDVTVYGATLNTDLIAETRHAMVHARFLDDPAGEMQKWATPDDWMRGAGNRRIHRYDFYGDHWMTLTVTPSASKGRLALVLSGSEGNTNAGQRATIERDAAGKTTCTLFHDDTVLAKSRGPILTSGEDYTIRLHRTDSQLALEIDGDTILDATDPRSSTGHRPAYYADGGFSGIAQALVLGRNFRDDTFAESPVDWVPEGTWMPTIRWSCQPQWSFYSGWSRGRAVLWNKRRYSGDQSMQVFMAYKMEYPRETDIYDYPTRYHDMCISICTDGKNPLSGYALVSGLPNQWGRPSARTILYRNGVPVRTINLSVPGWGNGHRIFTNVELRKHGATIECRLFGALLCEYTDPNPIDGGVPAVWTNDNGISIARVRLHAEKTPQLNTDPRVVLDTPWYPEWANVGRPLTLDFSESWSTAGKPITLEVKPQKAPDGQPLPEVADKHVTLTPATLGDYWYQVTATDGAQSSPPFHFFLPAFNPALGRDDSHTLALYRFDEGTGEVVHDHGVKGPPLDLQLPAHSATPWLPGQGLVMRGTTPLMSRQAASKLMAIRDNKACTLEFWVSVDSVYSPTSWLSALMSWEESPERRNFLVGFHMYTLVLAPWGGAFRPTPGEAPNFPTLNGSYQTRGTRTGFQHIAITWDGRITRGYYNGTPLTQMGVSWNTDRWVASAPLLLGNQSDGQRVFLGAYYLVAIHDRCFTADEVRRHYQAGPSARDERGK